MNYMRKVFSLVVVLLLCVSMVLPVFAAEDNFVPSITYKPNPELVSDNDGHIGVIRDADGNVLDYVDHACLRITPIAYVWDEEIDVEKLVEDLLIYIYESLKDGSMEIPYEKHEGLDLTASNMVIRDLLHIEWACDEHPYMLGQDGNTLELDFDFGVVSDLQVYGQSYDEKTTEWNPLVSVVNNGDGTLTCVFDRLGAIEFSVPVAGATAAPAESAATTSTMPWIIAIAVAAVAIVGVLFAMKKKAGK